MPGWGKIKHPGSSHPILQQAMMPPIDQVKCRQKLQASGGILAESECCQLCKDEIKHSATFLKPLPSLRDPRYQMRLLCQN